MPEPVGSSWADEIEEGDTSTLPPSSGELIKSFNPSLKPNSLGRKDQGRYQDGDGLLVQRGWQEGEDGAPLQDRAQDGAEDCRREEELAQVRDVQGRQAWSEPSG